MYQEHGDGWRANLTAGTDVIDLHLSGLSGGGKLHL